MTTSPGWYHGTRRGFTQGGYLFPQSVHAGVTTSAPTAVGRVPLADSEHWAYMTRNLDLAWAYAWHAPGRGKPRVLVLEPGGVIEPDPEHSAAMDAWRCEYARVIQILTKPTISGEEALEGWVIPQTGAAI